MQVYIQTHGCQMNEYDSEKMLALLKSSFKARQTNQPENADLLLINTCSIREKAQEKVFSQLGRWRKFKDQHPDKIIAVAGCVAAQEGKNILKRSPYVDIVFGPQTLHRLPAMIEHIKTHKQPIIDISFPEIEKFDYLPKPAVSGAMAYVSIMEGCSKWCSYCIVPYTRGKEISRPFDDVLNEVSILADQGVKEIHLLGQNVNDYAGIMHDGSVADLALLIHYIAAIDEIKRIRFTTSHPTAFNQALIDAYMEEPKLANHLHLPIQSGSDRILAAMKRGYTVLEYKDKIQRLRAIRPNISLSSDFIIGFPGETEKDFQATLDVIKALNFDHSFSFIYSQRPGTPAAQMVDNVPLTTKKERLNIIQQQLNYQAQQISQSLIGKIIYGLVTEPSKKNPSELAARSQCNRVIHFQGPSQIGDLIPLHILTALPNCLRARKVNPS